MASGPLVPSFYISRQQPRNSSNQFGNIRGVLCSSHNHATEQPKFDTITPKILYFGNPVALISSVNQDGTPNLAPISSFWALGWTMTLGLLSDTKTLKNLEMRPDCVINIPSPDLWRQVESLAPQNGSR